MWSSSLQWSFKIHNGRRIIKDTDKTTLAFNNADDARLWHQTFQSIIADLAAKQGVEVSDPKRSVGMLFTLKPFIATPANRNRQWNALSVP